MSGKFKQHFPTLNTATALVDFTLSSQIYSRIRGWIMA